MQAPVNKQVIYISVVHADRPATVLKVTGCFESRYSPPCGKNCEKMFLNDSSSTIPVGHSCSKDHDMMVSLTSSENTKAVLNSGVQSPAAEMQTA
jgi:hypothetical protein